MYRKLQWVYLIFAGIELVLALIAMLNNGDSSLVRDTLAFGLLFSIMCRLLSIEEKLDD